MNRFSHITFIVLAMLFLAPAQAMVNIDAGAGALCQVFADGEQEDGKKKDGKEEDGKEGEEEEPDCD